jgi:hypothetical protein
VAGSGTSGAAVVATMLIATLVIALVALLAFEGSKTR